MKKLISVLLTAVMVLSLAACGGSPAPAASSNPSAASQPEQSSAPETPETPEPEAPETPEPAEVPETPKTDFPTAPITMIIPYGAGGTTDLVGRQLAIALEKQLGQSVIVENQAGASGTLGLQATLDAPADGYTIVLAAEAMFTCRVMGISDISAADFAPISAVASDPKVLVVASHSKYETISDLLDEISANPGKVQMSYTGPGGSGHIQALLMNRYGYEPALTAYESGAAGITAVLGDQVQFTNSNYSTVIPYLESGDLRLLAVCSTEKMPRHPDVPALVDYMPGSEDMLNIPYSPLSLLVSRDVPAEVQEVLRNATVAACQDPDFNAWLDENGVENLYNKYPTIQDTLGFFSAWESKVCWMLDEAGVTAKSPEEFNIPKG